MELPTELYGCRCQAPKPLIYEQLGIHTDVHSTSNSTLVLHGSYRLQILELTKEFATRVRLPVSAVRPVQVKRPKLFTTPKTATHLTYSDIQGYIARRSGNQWQLRGSEDI